MENKFLTKLISLNENFGMEKRYFFDIFNHYQDMKIFENDIDSFDKIKAALFFLFSSNGSNFNFRNFPEKKKGQFLKIKMNFFYSDQRTIRILNKIIKRGEKGLRFEKIIYSFSFNQYEITLFRKTLARTGMFLSKIKKSHEIPNNKNISKLKFFFFTSYLKQFKNENGNCREKNLAVLVSAIICRSGSYIGGKCLKYGIFSFDKFFLYEEKRRIHRIWQKIRKKCMKSGILTNWNEKRKISNIPPLKLILLNERNQKYFLQEGTKSPKKMEFQGPKLTDILKDSPELKVFKLLLKNQRKGIIAYLISDQFRGYICKKRVMKFLSKIMKNHNIKKVFEQIGRQRITLFKLSNQQFLSPNENIVQNPSNYLKSENFQFEKRAELVKKWARKKILSIKGLGKKLAIEEARGLSKVDSKVVKRILTHLIGKKEIRIIRIFVPSSKNKFSGLEFVVKRKFSSEEVARVAMALKMSNTSKKKIFKIPKLPYLQLYYTKFAKKKLFQKNDRKKILNRYKMNNTIPNEILFLFKISTNKPSFFKILEKNKVNSKLRNFTGLSPIINSRKCFEKISKKQLDMINLRQFKDKMWKKLKSSSNLLKQKKKIPWFPFLTETDKNSGDFLEFTGDPKGYSLIGKISPETKKISYGTISPAKIRIKKRPGLFGNHPHYLYRKQNLGKEMVWGSELDANLCSFVLKKKDFPRILNQNYKKRISTTLFRRYKIISSSNNIKMSNSLVLKILFTIGEKLISNFFANSLVCSKRALELADGDFSFRFFSIGLNISKKKLPQNIYPCFKFVSANQSLSGSNYLILSGKRKLLSIIKFSNSLIFQKGFNRSRKNFTLFLIKKLMKKDKIFQIPKLIRHIKYEIKKPQKKHKRKGLYHTVEYFNKINSQIIYFLYYKNTITKILFGENFIFGLRLKSATVIKKLTFNTKDKKSKSFFAHLFELRLQRITKISSYQETQSKTENGHFTQARFLKEEKTISKLLTSHFVSLQKKIFERLLSEVGSSNQTKIFCRVTFLENLKVLLKYIGNGKKKSSQTDQLFHPTMENFGLQNLICQILKYFYRFPKFSFLSLWENHKKKFKQSKKFYHEAIEYLLLKGHLKKTSNFCTSFLENEFIQYHIDQKRGIISNAKEIFQFNDRCNE